MIKQILKATTPLVAVPALFVAQAGSPLKVPALQKFEKVEEKKNAVTTDVRLKEKWVQMAQEKIAAAYQTKQTGRIPLERNKLINKAYAEMYFSNPELFKWAGLAAFASYSIRKKMLMLWYGKALRIPALLTRGAKALPLWAATSAFDYEYAIVGEGNKAIYEDIYWQHLAYRDGGFAEIERIFKQGDIPLQIFKGWRQLEEGRLTGNQELIWEANVSLLMFEQQQVIQPVLYSGKLNNPFWVMVSLVHHLTGILLTSPVPEEGQTFRDCVPGGNVANFKERWQWCVENIMPAWRDYETQHPGKVKALLSEFL